MLLNMINVVNGHNEVKGFIEGTAIIYYAHFKEQFEKRLAPLHKLFGKDIFKYERYEEEIQKVIDARYKDILLKEKTVITLEVPIMINGKKYLIETATVIHASFPAMDQKHPDNPILPEYKKYFKKKKIYFTKKVITVETVAYKVKTDNERNVTFADEGNKEKVYVICERELRSQAIKMTNDEFIAFMLSIPEDVRFQRITNKVQLLYAKAIN